MIFSKAILRTVFGEPKLQAETFTKFGRTVTLSARRVSMEQDSPSQRFFIAQKLHSEGQILVFCKGLKMQILTFQFETEGLRHEFFNLSGASR